MGFYIHSTTVHSVLCSCRANDAPYGRFRIEDPLIVVDQSVFSEISRTFVYAIVRENGLIGDVLLNVVTTYNPVSTVHTDAHIAVENECVFCCFHWPHRTLMLII